LSDNAVEWRWVGEDGVEKTVAEQELIAELSSESLPNYTLVWKKGWLEWLPAMQVAELAWALPPGKADDVVKPREKAEAASPPAPPLYRYPVIKRRAENLSPERLPPPRAPAAPPRPPLKKQAASPNPPRAVEPPTIPFSDLSDAVAAAPKAALEPKTELFEPTKPRAVEPPTEPFMPSFEDVDMDSIKESDPLASALRLHAGAEDEAEEVEPEDDSAPDQARGGGYEPAEPSYRKAYGEEDDADTRVIPSRPPPPGPLYVGPHTPPASEKPPPSYEEPELPRIPPPPPPPADLAAYARIPTRPGLAERRNKVRLGYALAGMAGVVAIAGLVALVRSGSSSEAPQPSAEPGATAPSSPSGRPLAAASLEKSRPKPAFAAPPCTVLAPATRLSEWAEPAVTPSFATIPGSSRVAVGLAQSDVYAVGITIDPRTLDRDQVFRDYNKKKKLVSVVPVTDGDHLRFEVIRDGYDLDDARAVDAKTPFVIGATASGLARKVDKRDPETIWPLPDKEITTPRVATIPGFGHAVAFRRGGKTGRVAMGWLDPLGAKKSALADVASGGDFTGTPAIAATEDSVLVAFASRGVTDRAWSVLFAAMKPGALPKSASRFEPPPGGPGGDDISPSAAPLAGGRWLLQWTEGSSGNRIIRAQVLGSDLSPLSEPINLSPAGVNAGQGVVWASDDLGTILFYVQSERKGHELWGTSIECPR
jgi:hypothetical protein